MKNFLRCVSPSPVTRMTRLKLLRLRLDLEPAKVPRAKTGKSTSKIHAANALLKEPASSPRLPVKAKKARLSV